MTLFEYNNMDLKDRHAFIFGLRGDHPVRFSCLRDDGDSKYSLWDCGEFYVEMCAINGKVIKAEGIELTDDRINLYIDWIIEHKDDS